MGSKILEGISLAEQTNLPPAPPGYQYVGDVLVPSSISISMPPPPGPVPASPPPGPAPASPPPGPAPGPAPASSPPGPAPAEIKVGKNKLDANLLQSQQGERAGRFGSSLEKFTHPDLPGKIIYYNPETGRYATDPKSLRLLAPGQTAWELTKRGLGAVGKGAATVGKGAATVAGTMVKNPITVGLPTAAITAAAGEEYDLWDAPIYQKGDVKRFTGAIDPAATTLRATADLLGAQETVRNFPTIKNPTPEQIAAHRDAKEFIARMTAPPQGSAPTAPKPAPQSSASTTSTPPTSTPPTSTPPAATPPPDRRGVRAFEESADLQHLKRLIKYGRH
jgi:hypothetical protein